jgi:hypothetical protein
MRTPLAFLLLAGFGIPVLAQSTAPVDTKAASASPTSRSSPESSVYGNPCAMLQALVMDPDLTDYERRQLDFFGKTLERLWNWQQGIDLNPSPTPVRVFESLSGIKKTQVIKRFKKPDRITHHDLPDILVNGAPIQSDCLWYGPVGFCFTAWGDLYEIHYQSQKHQAKPGGGEGTADHGPINR